MRNDASTYDGKKQQSAGRAGRANGLLPNSFKAISGYLKSGASTVASTVRSVVVVDREGDGGNGYDQVHWSGFDKLECDGGVSRRVLMLGYQFGFQVWDVEEADNVRELVLRRDGPVSIMQMLPIPLASKRSEDKFSDSRPLLVVCADSAGGSVQDDSIMPLNGRTSSGPDPCSRTFVPTVVRFYSLKSQSYLHVLKFRSGICSVNCSSRIIAVLQEAQIHCFDATTLEREYTILTNPVIAGSGGIGCGPFAVGPRWLAYSGSPVVVSNSGRVTPQHLTPSPSNGNLVAHYAKESGKQLAAGIVTLGDFGYKKLSRYCSELLPDSNNCSHSETAGSKGNRTVNGHSSDSDNVGMVIVRDIVSKSIIAQFRAHKSPIAALCFDPSGTLLVTASVLGHNINVYRIAPGLSGYSSESDAGLSFVHLYTLQRGLTSAVIQDVSFSDDSNWIVISSSRGTSHLFAISPFGGPVNFESADASIDARNCRSGLPNPVTLPAVSRIRSGNSGWKGTVSGAAAAATGRMVSLPGAIASSFHKFKGKDLYAETGSLKSKYHLLVFSPSGSLTQYMLRLSTGLDSTTFVPTTYESSPEADTRLVVQAIQKWNVCRKQSQRDREDNVDIYGENGMSCSNKTFHGGCNKISSVYPESSSVAKPKISHEERHHFHISEAELQMHQAHAPLWARPEIYFQSMTVEEITVHHKQAVGGEIEIERFSTRMIEAKCKNVIPVLDYPPKFQQARSLSLDRFNSGQLLHQRSGLSENGRLSCRSRSCSPDSITDGGGMVPTHCNGTEKNDKDGFPIGHKKYEGFVNNNESSKTQQESVNNREFIKKAQLNFVNNNREGLKMENQSEEEGDEFD